jgi:hypothetical protein
MISGMNKTGTRNSPLSNEEGELVSNAKDKLEVCRKHFEKLTEREVMSNEMK